MRNIQSREEFEKLVNDERYLVIDFTAKWCGPCQMLKPLLNWVEEQYPKLVVVSVETDKFSKLSEEYGVKMIPNLCFMRDGKIEKRFVGVPKMEELRKYVRDYLGIEKSHSLLFWKWG